MKGKDANDDGSAAMEVDIDGSGAAECKSFEGVNRENVAAASASKVAAPVAQLGRMLINRQRHLQC